MLAIVGGGCSGVLAAIHLLGARPSSDVAVIDPDAQLGRGIAYSTPWPDHLLNAPARQMSALASQPAHFVEWLHRRDLAERGDETFAPRHVYGDYLQDTLRAAIDVTEGRGRVTHVRAEAVDVHVTSRGCTLTMNDGGTMEASAAVLAIGNAAPASIAGMPAGDGRVFASAWESGALNLRSPDERVLLIGAGLTAVDAALAFGAQGHRGPLHVVSRRGRLPQPHEDGRVERAAAAIGPRVGLRSATRALRRQLQDGRWREAIDGLRPVTNEIWRGWSLDERRRFQRHLKVYWDAHRHRMAPSIGAALDRWRDGGRLLVHAGRIRDYSSTTAGLDVTIFARGSGAASRIQVDRIVNCTGIDEKYATSRRPLVRAILASGHGRANQMGTGFLTNEDGALIDRSGRASTRLFTIGPPRYGDLLETIAVPEIRQQAECLARRLAPEAPEVLA